MLSDDDETPLVGSSSAPPSSLRSTRGHGVISGTWSYSLLTALGNILDDPNPFAELSHIEDRVDRSHGKSAASRFIFGMVLIQVAFVNLLDSSDSDDFPSPEDLIRSFARSHRTSGTFHS